MAVDSVQPLYSEPETSQPETLRFAPRKPLRLSDLPLDVRRLIALEVQNKPKSNRFPQGLADQFRADSESQEDSSDTLKDIDLLSLAGTCQEFREICMRLLCHTVELEFRDGLSTISMLLTLLSSYGSWVYRLSIRFISRGDFNTQVEYSERSQYLLAADAIRLCPHLRGCDLLRMDFRGNLLQAALGPLNDALAGLKLLTMLSLGSDMVPLEHCELLRLIRNLPFLERLVCTGGPGSSRLPVPAEYLEPLQKLKHLSLIGFPDFLNLLSTERFRNSLQSVRLSSDTFTDSRSLHAFLSCVAASITHLDIGSLRYMYVDASFDALHELPHLTSLTLRNGCPIKLLRTFASCQSLTTVRIIYKKDSGTDLLVWPPSDMPPSLRSLVVIRTRNSCLQIPRSFVEALRHTTITFRRLRWSLRLEDEWREEEDDGMI